MIAIEQEMKKIIQEDLPIIRHVVSRQDAMNMFEALGGTAEIGLIRDLPEDAVITVYRQGEFADLCRGPLFLPRAGSKRSN